MPPINRAGWQFDPLLVGRISPRGILETRSGALKLIDVKNVMAAAFQTIVLKNSVG